MVFKKGDLILRIEQDGDAFDPRQEENIARFICFDRHYKLGDENDFEDMEELREYIKSCGDDVVTIPLTLYEHSGVQLMMGNVHDWDCRFTGYAFITKKDYIKNGFEDVKDWKNKATSIILGELEHYNDFLTGDVYSLTLIESVKCDCCGHIDYKYLDSIGDCYGNIEELKQQANDYFGVLIDEEWEEAE